MNPCVGLEFKILVKNLSSNTWVYFCSYRDGMQNKVQPQVLSRPRGGLFYAKTILSYDELQVLRLRLRINKVFMLAIITVTSTMTVINVFAIMSNEHL